MENLAAMTGIRARGDDGGSSVAYLVIQHMQDGSRVYVELDELDDALAEADVCQREADTTDVRLYRLDELQLDGAPRVEVGRGADDDFDVDLDAVMAKLGGPRDEVAATPHKPHSVRQAS